MRGGGDPLFLYTKPKNLFEKKGYVYIYVTYTICIFYFRSSFLFTPRSPPPNLFDVKLFIFILFLIVDTHDFYSSDVEPGVQEPVKMNLYFLKF